MTSLPSNISRVPNLLGSRVLLANLTRTNLSLLDVQSRMASGRAVERMSDDAIRASAIAVLEDRLERSEQVRMNLSAAQNSLSLLDSSLGDASDLVQEAIGIASSQIGVGSDAQTRANQAVVIDAMIRQVVDLTNRQTGGVHVFGGSTPTRPPLVETRDGYRYVGRGPGLYTDLRIGERIPVTLGGENSIGRVSSRLRSTADLDPALTGETRVASLNGAAGAGVTLGVVSFSFGGGPGGEVDLSGADSVGNVIERLEGALRQYEAEHGVTILGPGGVGTSGGSITIDIGAGTPGAALVFADTGSGVTARDLGLSAAAFDAGNSAGGDLDPRVTLQTPLSALGTITLPMDGVRLRLSHAGGTTTTIRDVDLSGAATIDDVRRLIEDTGLGVRVSVNAAGTGMDVVSEIAGPTLSIEEIPGGPSTATQLGIRSLAATTAIADFNGGRGVRIVHGVTNPQTGAVDPALNIDFVIRLGNGDSFGVDLRPQDLVSVQSVIERINGVAAEAEAAGLIPPGAVSAGLTNARNGIALFDTAGLGPIGVERANNSGAAEDLGLLGGEFLPGSATFVAQDRAGIRVDNLLSALIDLRDALRRDDSTGITVAGEGLGVHADRLASARSLVGVYAQRVEQAGTREDDLAIFDERARRELQDLDFAEASIRFNLLRSQLQAGLATGAQAQSLSLLDFLR